MKTRICIVLALLLSLILPVNVSGAENDVAAVRSLVEALPTVEEFKALDPEQQLEAYNRTQAAYDAYNALTADEKQQMNEAENIFESLFAYFNTLIMPISGAEEPTVLPTETVTQVHAEPASGVWWIGAMVLMAAAILIFRRKK